MPGPDSSRRSRQLPDAGDDSPPSDRRFFAARDGDLVVTDAGGGVVWDGAVGGGKVVEAVDLGDFRHALVLLDWSTRPAGVEEWHPFPNVLKVNAAGQEIWRAELPRSETLGSYTGVRVESGQPIAVAWAGFSILDPADGRIVEYVFTK